MKVETLSGLRTGRLYPPADIPVHISVSLSRPQGHSAAGRIKSVKNHDDPIGNRTFLLVAPRRTPRVYFNFLKSLYSHHENFLPSNRHLIWALKQNFGVQKFKQDRDAVTAVKPWLIIKKSKSIPVQTCTRPKRPSSFRLPVCLDNRHMKVVKLPALRTDDIHSPGNIPGTHFC
jgi:hypothetical protein